MCNYFYKINQKLLIKIEFKNFGNLVENVNYFVKNPFKL